MDEILGHLGEVNDSDDATMSVKFDLLCLVIIHTHTHSRFLCPDYVVDFYFVISTLLAHYLDFLAKIETLQQNMKEFYCKK